MCKCIIRSLNTWHTALMIQIPLQPVIICHLCVSMYVQYICALCDVCWTEAVGVQCVVVLRAVTSLPHVHVMTQGVCVCF